MGRYISAEKLIVEIEGQMNECLGRFGEIHKLPEYRCLKNIHSHIISLQKEEDVIKIWLTKQFNVAQKCMKSAERDWERAYEIGQMEAYGKVLSFIGGSPYEPSKQEQPELPGYDKALLEVKSKVDELYEEAGIGLCEYDSGFYNGIAETCMKLRGFIKARLGSDKQPESELEKAARYVYESWMGGTMDDVRRDMVELGKVLNARK